jgi:pentose-5-phosphate-3-epimerase/membrane protein CcdC involved in cytochrome C biogenesis
MTQQDGLTLSESNSPTPNIDHAQASVTAANAPRSRVGLWQRFVQKFWRRSLAYYVYRHRYLACFTVIGLFSILLELMVLPWLPAWWPWSGRIAVAFVVGTVFSLVFNVTVNFHVPRQHLLRTSAWFVAISLFSFGMNTAIVLFLHATTDVTYGWLRLVISGFLFIIAYSLHRAITFDQSRNFGIAIYASELEDVGRIFESLGHCCDHVHVDLVDRTVLETAAPVCLERIDEVRQRWHGFEICLHVMSRRPRRWAVETWDRVDWYLFSCDIDDDLMTLIFDCRHHGKKVGVVWNNGIPIGKLMPYLPHVDFVMVLGIDQPGKSGQSLNEECLAVAHTLESMRPLYHYDLMFDGGVKANNVSHIAGRYIVSASGVLNAECPTTMAHYLSKSRYQPQARQRKVA